MPGEATNNFCAVEEATGKLWPVKEKLDVAEDVAAINDTAEVS